MLAYCGRDWDCLSIWNHIENFRYQVEKLGGRFIVHWKQELPKKNSWALRYFTISLTTWSYNRLLCAILLLPYFVEHWNIEMFYLLAFLIPSSEGWLTPFSSLSWLYYRIQDHQSRDGPTIMGWVLPHQLLVKILLVSLLMFPGSYGGVSNWGSPFKMSLACVRLVLKYPTQEVLTLSASFNKRLSVIDHDICKESY